MTRFLLSLNQAVDLIFAALCKARPAETYVPQIPSATVTDIAGALIGDRAIQITIVGIRPGEKMHEILVSEEECRRTVVRGEYYAIRPILPELNTDHASGPFLESEYSSQFNVLSRDETRELLHRHHMLTIGIEPGMQEILR